MVTTTATANVRIVAFLVSLLLVEQSDISQAILSGCYVVGGPIRDVFRWVRTIWFFASNSVAGKAPDDIDLSADPSQFLFMGSDFMIQICDYIVKLLDGKVLLGDTVSAAWSGPDSGTYKINIQWKEHRGDKQITIDLSQFKSEKNGEIALMATIKDDANRRDLTLNALYCPIGDAFVYVIPTANENMMWFNFLLTMTLAYFFGKVLDPTGSGIYSLKHNQIDLCGVREAFLICAEKLTIVDSFSEISETGVVRTLLVHGNMKESELLAIEDGALNTIFEAQNIIRAFRNLRETTKGAIMPYWLQKAVERWIDRFLVHPHTPREIQSKSSLLVEKLPKLVPNASSIPAEFCKLLTFFLENSGKGKAVMFHRDLFFALLRHDGATVENVRSWTTRFPKLLQEDLSRPSLIREDSIPFLLKAIQAGYTVNAAISCWLKPSVKGSVISPEDDKFTEYKAFVANEFAEGRMRGLLNDERVQTHVKELVVSRHRDVVLEKFLEAGPIRIVVVCGTVENAEFKVSNKIS